MDALLTVITTWLSINFGLPSVVDHPQVQFVDPPQMFDVHTSHLSADDIAKLRSAEDAGINLIAVYDDRSRTIYLPADWSASSPADVSVLVHEMVHHLQRFDEKTFACAEEREKPAYAAQARWLEHVGTSLEEEFELDAMSLLFLTKCYR